MAYSSTNYLTEFAGKYKAIMLLVDPDGATGSIDLSSYFANGLVGAVATFAADATANCYTISLSISTTTISFKLWKAGGTAADTAYVDFYCLAIGY